MPRHKRLRGRPNLTRPSPWLFRFHCALEAPICAGLSSLHPVCIPGLQGRCLEQTLSLSGPPGPPGARTTGAKSDNRTELPQRKTGNPLGAPTAHLSPIYGRTPYGRMQPGTSPLWSFATAAPPLHIASELPSTFSFASSFFFSKSSTRVSSPPPVCVFTPLPLPFLRSPPSTFSYNPAVRQRQPSAAIDGPR